MILRQAEPYGPQHDQRMFDGSCVEKKKLLFGTMMHHDDENEERRGPKLSDVE